MNDKRLGCVLLLTAVLFGSNACASNRGGYTTADEAAARLVGMSLAEVATRLGAPTEKMDIDDAGQVISYRDETAGATGGSCRVSLTVNNGVVTSASVLSFDRSPLTFPLGGCQSVIAHLD